MERAGQGNKRLGKKKAHLVALFFGGSGQLTGLANLMTYRSSCTDCIGIRVPTVASRIGERYPIPDYAQRSPP